MALHGTIEINGVQIGHYYIRRTEPVPEDGVALYEYEVSILAYAPNGLTVKGHVHHQYYDGALKLIGKVMQQCPSYLPTSEPA